MEQVYIKESPKGTFSCDIDITQEEWQQILANPDVTTPNYKFALMAFYKESGHRATCKNLGMKYYGNAIDAQKFNSWITKFGQAVVKHLNRFHIVDDDEKERFWHVAMCSGTQKEDGLFETTLRPELVSAIESLGWKDDILSGSPKTDINYWLVGFTYGDYVSQLDRFLHDGIWESYFNNEKKNDKNLLQATQSIKRGDVLILKSTSTKGKNHDIPFLRVKGIGVVESDIKSEKVGAKTKCSCSVLYVDSGEKEFVGNKYGGYRKTIHKADSKAQAIIDYAYSILTIEKKQDQPMKYKHYVDLLKESHNLVLTGAPGTGKTYMAQHIAEEMGCTENEMCFVQFHPSYDYTDFVEGLRPVEKADGQIGFERKDGVFKEFCKRAVKNLVDSQKSVEILENELSWGEKMQQFIENAIDENTELKLRTGNIFTIDGMNGRNIVIHNDHNEKTPQVSVSADDVIELLANDAPLDRVKNVRNYFDRKLGYQSDSYTFVIAKKIREMQPTSIAIPTASTIKKKNFVFIIDEINRGEASKIFGELFYAIDPGYRVEADKIAKKDGRDGVKVRVKTQYQNLVPENDIFHNGFYVPENVYILATMNDIDRSVESMDFAMRRRFTWEEIATDNDLSLSMLNNLDCKAEAIDRMTSLNAVISKTDGLGSAYQVGASYFLKLGDNGGDFKKLWTMNIKTLLKEYLRGFRNADSKLKDMEKAYNNPNADYSKALSDAESNTESDIVNGQEDSAEE